MTYLMMTHSWFTDTSVFIDKCVARETGVLGMRSSRAYIVRMSTLLGTVGLHRLDFHSFTDLEGQHFQCSFTLKAEVGRFFSFYYKIIYIF